MRKTWDHLGGGERSFIVALALLCAFTAGAYLALLAGCSADANRKAIDTTLDTAQVLCVLAKSEWSDSAAIMRACGIAENLKPVVDQILGEHRARVSAAACQRDAGTQ